MMTNIKCYIFLLIHISYANSFVTFNPSLTICPRQNMITLRAHNNTGNFNITKSKVYKMDYRSDEEKELEEFYKPRYLFNLSEFHMTFARIYVYIVIILNCVTLWLQRL